jgi:hypothetical protein
MLPRTVIKSNRREDRCSTAQRNCPEAARTRIGSVLEFAYSHGKDRVLAGFSDEGWPARAT